MYYHIVILSSYYIIILSYSHIIMLSYYPIQTCWTWVRSIALHNLCVKHCLIFYTCTLPLVNRFWNHVLLIIIICYAFHSVFINSLYYYLFITYACLLTYSTLNNKCIHMCPSHLALTVLNRYHHENWCTNNPQPCLAQYVDTTSILT